MDEFRILLRTIGQGRMSLSAYDTAWVARLNEFDSSLSNQALQWVCEHQLPDGGWGAEYPQYYHDRVVSTLSAMIVLTKRGRRAYDRLQIELGLLALEQITANATGGLRADPNGATVGFEMIAPMLVEEAESLGIIKQQGDRILGRMKKLREAKMSKLAGIQFTREITPAFSAEMAGTRNIDLLDARNLQEENGSVANSPAASAHFVLNVNRGDERALNYLRETIEAGGFPFAAPFDIFERAWVLWNLLLASPLDAETTALCKPHLDHLQQAWKPGKGVSFSSYYTPTDGDDTSLTFEVLTRMGRKVDIQTVLSFEETQKFRCYPIEVNPSVSVNVHVLGALRQAGFDKTHPSVKKVISYLYQTRQDGRFWLDKWHLSPFYPTAHAVITAAGFDDDLCRDSVDWILKTQKADGSWGYFGASTAEETAYCLQALELWQRSGGTVPTGRIEHGSFWLTRHQRPPYPPLWIGKVVYSPENVVRSSILSALLLTQR